MTLASKLTTRLNPNESTIIERSVFFLIIGVAFYLLNRFSFIIADDYRYAFILATEERIKSISDILESQILHYKIWNGRFIVHCVVQLFCGLWSFEAFKIFNTIFFVAFCALTTRCITGMWRSGIVWYGLSAAILWLMLPAVGTIMLSNVACAVNYLWVAVINIAFLIYVFKYKEERVDSIYKGIFIILLSAIIGSLQESFSIPIVGAFMLYYIFGKAEIRNKNIQYQYLLIGYLIGTILLVFAPSNILRLFNRGAADGGDLFASSPYIVACVQRFIAIVFNNWLSLIFIVVHGVLLLVRRYRHWLYPFIVNHICLYLMLGIGVGFGVFVAFAGTHQLFFSGWIVIVILIKLCYMLYGDIANKLSKTIIILCAICMLPIVYYTMCVRSEIHKAHQDYVEAIKSSDNGIVVAGKWIQTCFKPKNIIEELYTRTALVYRRNYQSLYYTDSNDNIRNIIPVSIENIEGMASQNMVADRTAYVSDYYAHIFILPKNTRSIKVKVDYPAVGFGRIKRILLNQSMWVSYMKQNEDFEIVEDDNNKYYIMYDSESQCRVTLEDWE